MKKKPNHKMKQYKNSAYNLKHTATEAQSL